MFTTYPANCLRRKKQRMRLNAMHAFIIDMPTCNQPHYMRC